MHGQNKLRPVEPGDGSKLQVQDIWYTMQGEGPFFGMPAIFVRLTGCNLACDFCDTVWDDVRDPYLTADCVVHRISLLRAEHNCRLVVLTGGEPMRQNLELLIDVLTYQMNMKVQIETAGTYWQECARNRGVTVVCSPKTKHVHPKIKEHCNDWKYVIQAGHVNIYDGLPAGTTQFVPLSAVQAFVAPDIWEGTSEDVRKGLLTTVTASSKYGTPCRPPEGVTVWLSPCDEGNAEATQRNVKLVGQLALKYGYRAQVQLHKLMELP